MTSMNIGRELNVSLPEEHAENQNKYILFSVW